MLRCLCNDSTSIYTSHTIGLKVVRLKPDKPDIVVLVLPLNITGTIQGHLPTSLLYQLIPFYNVT